MSNEAFDALKTYDWGVDPKVLQPIDEAILATRGDAAARKELEARLAAVLATEAPRAAKDAACRALKVVGTAASVPALAMLLADENLSHMARYALESIPAPEAGQALLASLPKAAGKVKVGIISSLGVRGEEASVAALQAQLAGSDDAVARAAAHALGGIGSLAAGKALHADKPTPATQAAIADASMKCAEKLLASGNKDAAKATYQKLLDGSPSKQVQLAATQGLQACGGK